MIESATMHVFSSLAEHMDHDVIAWSVHRFIPSQCFTVGSRGKLQKHTPSRYLKLQELAFKVTQVQCCAGEAGRATLPDFSKLHSCICRVRIRHIRARGVWHATRLFHRMRISLLTSEMRAESTASAIRFVERRHAVGHDLSLHTLMDSTMLRMHGVRGSMEELPFIWACLQEHFSGEIPHFFVQAGYRKRRELSFGPSPTLQRLRVSWMGLQAFSFSWLK